MENTKIKLSIGVVTYQSVAEISACLDSLAKFMPRASTEVIVVDNASSDGTAALIRKNYPNIHLIRNNKNLGFAAATNEAIKKSRGQYFLALNPDTRVTAGALDRLLLIAQALPDLGSLGAKLTYPDGAAQPSSYPLPSLWSELRKLIALEKIDERQARRDTFTRVGWSWGAALLFPRLIKGQVVLFDDNIFLYSEDLELCWRLRKKGLQNYVTAQAEIIHAHNKSAEQLYGSKISQKRIMTFKKTLRYVWLKHQGGMFKKIRFNLYTRLVAMNALWHYVLLKIFGKKHNPERLEDALREHGLRYKVFWHNNK